ncbi:MAG TPA: thioesterase family protein [Balneolaceae bacterium]|nr:thioesterase family protein [Balneolaceae bacterium]
MNHPEYSKKDFPHWHKITIRFRDLDPLNHVNNAIFSTYYEEARINFIRDVPGFTNQLKKGYSFVLAGLKIDFIKPVEYPAILLIGSGINSLGNTSISSFQAIYTATEKKLVSVAEAHGVWFDLQKQRPSRLPEIKDAEKFIVG